MANKPPESEHNLPRQIGKPATSALLTAGFTRLEQFTAVTEQEILQLHGVGPKAVGIIKHALAEKGLAFSESPD